MIYKTGHLPKVGTLKENTGRLVSLYLVRLFFNWLCRCKTETCAVFPHKELVRKLALRTQRRNA